MAYFYATADGSAKTAATRCGTKNSGIESIAASRAGVISTKLWYDKANDVDMAEVRMRPWHGQGVSALLYFGPVGEFKNIITPATENLENAQ